jgi:hypothetical protein
MTSYFVTGDRGLDPLTAINETIRGLTQAGLTPEDTLYTGSFKTGIERAVRYLFPSVTEIVHSDTDEGYADLAGRDEIVTQTVDRVVFIHSDPLASRIGRSLVDHITADKLVFV